MPVTRATFRFFCMARKNTDRPLFFLLLAVAAQRQNGALCATRSASPTLSLPHGRELLALQTGRPDMSETTGHLADESGSTRMTETAGDAVALKATATVL